MRSSTSGSDDTAAGRAVTRVLLAEGAANLAVLALKLFAGISTGSSAILSDALHSLADVANNALALMVSRISRAPPDRRHPYGHRKFETLAVFGFAALLSVMAFEIATGALRRIGEPVRLDGAALLVMLAVLAINTVVAGWQHYWARRLGSQLLQADARHTAGDVLTTVAVIAGWQVAARGRPWLDTVFAVLLSLLVLYLAYGLFRRAIPALVDEAAVDPQRLAGYIAAVQGVERVSRVRSRHVGDQAAADVVVHVGAELSTEAAHEIADAVEDTLKRHFGIRDVVVHVEPSPRRDR